MKSSFINPKIEFIYKKRFVKSNYVEKTFCKYKNNEQFIKKVLNQFNTTKSQF